ncbi:MAG: hypothetical protein H3C57_03190 [Gammaproteobacteria bacterium]|nr:hypothetical protein [Gammaproteobacteria bacterium]
MGKGCRRDRVKAIWILLLVSQPAAVRAIVARCRLSSGRTVQDRSTGFHFFATQKDGTVVAGIVDPHGYHLGDALPKLQGLAEYAASHVDVYRRVESIAEGVREAIVHARDAGKLYRSDLASDYL